VETTGIIGGSGLYELEGFEITETRPVQTPFGDPSADLVIGTLEGREVVFLPRHGTDHRFSPSTLPYRANIFALKTAGVTRILSISAVGSMKAEIHPGHVVLPDQLIDRTVGRARTFFDDGIAAHVGFGDPICASVRAVLKLAVEKAGVTVHDGGTYICIEGPQFSTRAESLLFRSWGVSVIGMTNLPEARLAREAEICYATIALSTDYDCWHPEHDDVTVESVLATLRSNVSNAKQIVRNAILGLPETDADCACRTALSHAIMTAPEAIGAELRRTLAPLIGKHVTS
jgi:5'-methylthioadenosine phosphorylase